MKHMAVIVLVVFITASIAHAANFTPTLLKLSAPETVQYDFDGNVLDIPVTVSGTRAGVIFCVFTKDQAVEQNGSQDILAQCADRRGRDSGIYGFNRR